MNSAAQNWPLEYPTDLKDLTDEQRKIIRRAKSIYNDSGYRFPADDEHEPDHETGDYCFERETEEYEALLHRCALEDTAEVLGISYEQADAMVSAW